MVWCPGTSHVILSTCMQHKSVYLYSVLIYMHMPEKKVKEKKGSRDSLLVECQIRGQKVASSSPSKSSGKVFFSRVHLLCWLLLRVGYSPVLLQLHIKDPCHSVKCRWQVTPKHAYTPWPIEVGVGWLCCAGMGSLAGKGAHRPLIREHSDTVLSARWATVNWSWPKKWNWCALADLHFKNK